MKLNDKSGPAFPVKADNSSEKPKIGFADDQILPNSTSTYPGLSRREYFAAAALQGLMAHYGAEAVAPSTMANFAAKLADALIAELDK